VFLDSLCNSKAIAVPDLCAVVGALSRWREPVCLIIDNTGLSCSFQPYGWLPSHQSSLHILLFESLTKYPQFGLDRTTAGMIVASDEDGDELDTLREHLGSNVPDTSVGVIPWPDRARLEGRLARLGRNADLLARRLQHHAEQSARSALRRVIYPGLRQRPSIEMIAPTPFRSGFLSLELAPEFEHDEGRAAFVRLSLEEAERQGEPLAAGASFGLNTTRIYLTASNSEPARAFIRISPGTEHRLQIQALASVFEEALRRFPERVLSPSSA
jgi:cystathionine beta-lyase/cystathionine gamma-synthase